MKCLIDMQHLWNRIEVQTGGHMLWSQTLKRIYLFIRLMGNY